MQSAALATIDSVCPPVCLFVCLSQSGIMPKRLQLRSCGLHWRITPWLYSFLVNIRSGAAKWERGSKNRQFLANKSPYLQKRCKIGPLSQGMTNSKSYMRFRLVPKSSTLDDPERPWMAKTHSVAKKKMRLLEPTAQIWIKTDPYLQRQKCRAMTSFWKYKVGLYLCAYSQGFLLAGASNESGSRTAIFGDLSGYFFGNFRDKASNIIWRHATLCWPVTDCKMNDLEWHWVAM